jgi:hypothetical protein
MRLPQPLDLTILSRLVIYLLKPVHASNSINGRITQDVEGATGMRGGVNVAAVEGEGWTVFSREGLP